MFSTLLERIGNSPRALAREEVRASPSDSLDSANTVASNLPSSSATPPTSIGDSVSISSTSLKLENTDSPPAEQASSRSRRARASVGTYNVKVLSGTAIHAPKKFSKDPAVIEARRRTISGETLIGALDSRNSSTATIQKDANRLVADGIDALDLQWSVKALPKSRSQIGLTNGSKKTAKQMEQERRRATRSSGEKIESLTKKLSVLGKRSRKTFEDGLAGLTRAKRELMNLADTNEFAKIDTKPVIHEVWSNGKLVVAEPPAKKKKVEQPKPVEVTVEKEEEKLVAKKIKGGKREKTWLSKGLYAGQDIIDLDWYKDCSAQKKKEMEEVAPFRPNSVLPLPMWHGQRLLEVGRDFKLPFDVCSPLPPGQPKPDEWRKTSSNRFIGEAGNNWKDSKYFDSFSSRCVCNKTLGCDEDCQNRIMFYECDDTNCAAGRKLCTNRAFAGLMERKKAGGKYRIGVEVIKTIDRGYGVRSNRCFEAGQIIVEYTGEIITEEECDRRMNEDYKDNECYYLMSFDQGMIIDATKGSIARFVNHSCKPNCRMVKWIVGGKPRMALFAGDNPIMTGEELTYDYNFDPFSAKNIQECRCGSDNCRGVLGPKPKDVKPVKETIKEVVKATVKAGKRKLKELLGGDDTEEEDRSPKKRKLKVATGVKKSSSAASMKKAKEERKAAKKNAAKLLNARQEVRSKRVVKKTMKARLLTSYGRGRPKISARSSSLTIVSKPGRPRKQASSTQVKKSVRKSVVHSIRGSGKQSRGASGSTIRVITQDEEVDEE